MEISLIRHGKSKLMENDRITLSEFKSWAEKYDEYGVFEESIYPSGALEKITSSNIVFCSNLKRSIESAKLLNANIAIISEPLFRETELPLPSAALFYLKLKPLTWIVIIRLLWIFGFSKRCESFRQAKCRAKEAAQKLVDNANRNGFVVLVGHGFFNRLIVKELRKKGWKSNRKISAKHWSCATYTFDH